MTRAPEFGRPCSTCGEPGAAGESSCRRCGALVGQSVECERHPGTRAEAACVVCGMPLCRSCIRTRPALCADPEHSAISERWVRVFATNSEFEADCLTQNLKDRAIASKTFSSRRFAGVAPTTAADAVRVFVRAEDLERAASCLAELTGALGDGSDSILGGI